MTIVIARGILCTAFVVLSVSTALADEWKLPADEALLLDSALAVHTIERAVDAGYPDVIVHVLKSIRSSANGKYVVDSEHKRRYGILLRLLRYPDLRVQFAAADAAMHLLPDRPIPSAYYLLATLTRMVATDSVPVALVIDGDATRANESAAILQQIGYQVLVGSTGRAGFRIAAAQAIDFVIIEPSIGNWSVRDTVVNLKADRRTAGIPVFLYDTNRFWWRPADQLQLKQRLNHLANDQNQVTSVWAQPRPAMGRGVYVVRRPSTLNDWFRVSQHIIGTPRSSPLTAEERAAYRFAALNWIHLIARRDFPNSGLRLSDEHCEPIRILLYDLDLGIAAARSLAHCPSLANQEELAAAGMNTTLPDVVRVAALDALGTNISRSSCVLSRRTILALLRQRQSLIGKDVATSMSRLIGIMRSR